MLITLIRHSKTKFDPQTPNPLWQLSDEGIELAKQLSISNEIKTMDVIYSSLQTKALQTALLLAKDNKIPIKTNKNLTELTSITNKFIEDYEGEVHKLYTGEIDRINEGETIEEGKNRFNNAINEIIQSEQSAKNIGIVAHGNILSIFSSQYSSKSPYELHQIIKMPDLAILDWETKTFTKFYTETK